MDIWSCFLHVLVSVGSRWMPLLSDLQNCGHRKLRVGDGGNHHAGFGVFSYLWPNRSVPLSTEDKKLVMDSTRTMVSAL
ncbi:hypothetical protein O6H91_16G040600 [Diphasiastrum complanatum]|uniref:Uncharacterized protein n=1 Tax=Diphasiastrum complanatum TaxID=34168 RepID=A0ACC2BBM7_DIPCM|nr:hypothetical protein O6H91_16G040600 [Diphasiastrum complanatum]